MRICSVMKERVKPMNPSSSPRERSDGRRTVLWMGVFVGIAASVVIGAWAHAQMAPGPLLHTMTYRGYIETASGPLDENVDLEFEAFDAVSGGKALGGSPVRVPGVAVVSGQFSVQLPFPAAVFASPSVWLEVRVGAAKTVVGRQRLSSVPYAANGNPPGTIIAFAGPVPPDGWLLCDGSALHSGDFPALYAAVGKAWGNGLAGRGAGNGTDFNLPDLRGRFLRGVDRGATRDPDAAQRASENGGATGDAVGSIQTHATALPAVAFALSGGAHGHKYRDDSGWSTCGTPSSVDCSAGESGHRSDNVRDTDVDGAHVHSVSGGDSETRPKNAGVNWMIKY
jgi:hypothetical protein